MQLGLVWLFSYSLTWRVSAHNFVALKWVLFESLSYITLDFHWQYQENIEEFKNSLTWTFSLKLSKINIKYIIHNTSRKIITASHFLNCVLYWMVFYLFATMGLKKNTPASKIYLNEKCIINISLKLKIMNSSQIKGVQICLSSDNVFENQKIMLSH